MTDIALHVDQTRAANTLGASDAAAALGLDKYRSPLTLWRQLRGLPTNEERPAFVQEAAEWGQALEPVIRGKYALSKSAAVYVPSSSWVKDEWLRATPDGLVVFCAPEGEMRERGARAVEYIRPGTYEQKPLQDPDGLLQVKTCSAYKRDEWEAGVPEAYEVQVRVEMAVTDLPWCDVVCLVGGQQLRGPFRIERDIKLEANILRDLRAFWERVQTGVEPDVDGSQAWRDYAGTRMRPTPAIMDADDETDALIANWVQARKTRKELEEAEQEYKTKLLLKLSAAGAQKIHSARFGNVPAYKVGGRTDWKGYALELGGHAKPPPKYVKESSTWTLRLPDGDDD